MKTLCTCLLATAAACAITMHGAQAQEATEQYIPIGESPGVSGYRSIIGTVADLDYDAGTVTVNTAEGTRSVSVDSKTRYYLDRSRQGASSESVDLHACKAGRRIEAAIDDDGNAEWIKVEAPATP